MSHVIPLRVLVIDDDPRACRQMQGWFDEARLDVAAFTEPAEGLRYAARVDCHVAVVDLHLGGVAGEEVVASLLRACPATRVIAISAFPSAEQVIAVVRAGARDVLERPIQRPALLAAVERQLSELGLAGRTEEEFNRRIGARLRELRSASGRALTDVARESGISPAQLSQIELGRNGASTWTLARVCGVLRVPLSTLFLRL